MRGPIIKKVIAILTALLFVGITIYFFTRERVVVEEPVPPSVPEAQITPLVPTSTARIIGTSVEGREITAHTFGNEEGDRHLLFVGGIHGGYEWNSVLLSYELMDYLETNPDSIPSNIAVTVIPSANPDGLFAVVGKEGRFSSADVSGDVQLGTGRFNAHGVDLNRNFDCKWKPKSTWRGNVVPAGTSAFSEPEAIAIRDFVLARKPTAVVFYHSQSNAVYASECTEGILPETRILMDTYASASKYPAIDTFDAYEITGDAEGWLASIGIPAVTVELSTHEAIEWERNLAGIQALLVHYGK